MIRLLYEDSHIGIIEKPAGVLTHTAPTDQNSPVLSDYLTRLWPSINTALFPPKRPFIVHRLDKDTSGLLVVAKTVSSLTKLSEQFKARTVNKVYIAAVHGRVSQDSWESHQALQKVRTRRQYKIAPASLNIANQSAIKQASTQFICLAKTSTKSILKIIPLTGRTHQIRVHLAQAGYPIIGDAQYGSKHRPKRSARHNRHYLAAQSLAFTHPITCKRLAFSLPLPPWALL